MKKEFKITTENGEIIVEANGYSEVELIGMLEVEKNRFIVNNLRRPDVEKVEYLLTSCLNDAMVGRGRIKGVVSSNKIGEFVNEWMLKNKL